MALDGKILRGLFEHERLNPMNIRTSQGYADYECRFKISLESKGQLSYHLKSTNI